MVQVRVAGVGMDEAGQHVILLKPLDAAPGEGEVLPVWIGSLEATSIMIAIEGSPTPRPLAHDLMRSLLTTAGAEVERTEITRLEEGTYFAEIVLRTGDGLRIVDARPSDAVALAARVDADIWVDDTVMAIAGVPDMTGGDGEDGEKSEDVRGFESASASDAGTVSASRPVADVDAEASVDEFKRFLADVDPDDFRN